jgi:hypothetical protein
MVFAGFTDDSEIATQAAWVNLVSHGLECRDDVVFGPPGLFLDLDTVFELVRGH